MKPSELNEFTLGYVLAALWLSDPSPGQGDYTEAGLSLVQSVDEWWMAQAVADCAKFQSENETLLEQAGTDSQNGHDFWLTRNRHGAGFCDRGYPDEIGDALKEASQKFGEVWLDWEELEQDETTQA